MSSPGLIERQINELITALVGKSLVDDQCFAFQKQNRRGIRQITFKGADRVSIALKDKPYAEIYQTLVQEHAYNLKMLDGALLQMMYEFNHATLHRHRLAFFSAPSFEMFQEYPNIYLDDVIDADVVERKYLPVAVRFDYDARAGVRRNLAHPRSHLSLGQFENCRIPVTRPMTPGRFLDFVLRNFYNTSDTQYTDFLPSQTGSFAESITQEEQGIVHLTIPA